MSKFLNAMGTALVISAAGARLPNYESVGALIDTMLSNWPLLVVAVVAGAGAIFLERGE